jgi:hypothetical protein
VREVLATELRLDSLDGAGADGGGAKVLGFDLKTLRSGVVVKTWWEQDIDQTESDDWRN